MFDITIENTLLDFNDLLNRDNLQEVAEQIVEMSYGNEDIMNKDSIDRFLDFVYFKIQTGNVYVENLAFPTRRIRDAQLEKNIKELINVHLYPEIILKILRFFTRNIYAPDTNLYIAYLINSKELIKSIYQTFLLIKKDIFIVDQDKRSLNVKRVQQFSPLSDNSLSSPLDTVARLKYILEYLLFKEDVQGIYTQKDLFLFNKEESA